MKTATQERGILFNGDMVRAILDGRKTVTRRPVKGQLPIEATEACFDAHAGSWFGWDGPNELIVGASFKSPFGVPGDLLYVREAFRPMRLHDGEWNQYAAGGYLRTPITRRLSRSQAEFSVAVDQGRQIEGERPWVPSIHMPKWAARIWLRVVSVRVERVQEITEEGAIAEGATIGDEWHSIPNPTHKAAFYRIWDPIYAAKDLDSKANPWVWVCEFERVDKPAQAQQGGA